MSENLRSAIAAMLVELECELRRLDVWEAYPPEPERLASQIPFCHDTLAFTQWTQWIFLPRFRAVLEGGHPLPTASAILPVAEVAAERIDGDATALLAVFAEIDRLITDGLRD